jgi:FkbM family methyltransferase
MIKKCLSHILSFLGITVARTGTGILGGKRLAALQKDKFKWIQELSIRTIIDIGAHEGEFASEIHRLLPEAKIYSFEPLAKPFKALNQRMQKTPHFKSYNFALSDREGEENMHCSDDFTPSSSFLEMSDMHKEAFPFTAKNILEKVYISTLDKIIKEKNFSLENNVLLKIDTQGHEKKVLQGAKETLKKVKIIMVETSFYELYKGQPLFKDVLDFLYQEGFYYAGHWGEPLRRPTDGMILQEDSLFIKSDKLLSTHQ